MDDPVSSPWRQKHIFSIVAFHARLYRVPCKTETSYHKDFLDTIKISIYIV